MQKKTTHKTKYILLLYFVQMWAHYCHVLVFSFRIWILQRYMSIRIHCVAFCAQTLGSKLPQWQSNFVSIRYNYLLSSLTFQFLFGTNETRVLTKCINATWRVIILFISGDVFSSRTGFRGCPTRSMSLVSVLSCPVNSLSTIVCTSHSR